MLRCLRDTQTRKNAHRKERRVIENLRTTKINSDETEKKPTSNNQFQISILAQKETHIEQPVSNQHLSSADTLTEASQRSVCLRNIVKSGKNVHMQRTT